MLSRCSNLVCVLSYCGKDNAIKCSRARYAAPLSRQRQYDITANDLQSAVLFRVRCRLIVLSSLAEKALTRYPAGFNASLIFFLNAYCCVVLNEFFFSADHFSARVCNFGSVLQNRYSSTSIHWSSLFIEYTIRSVIYKTCISVDMILFWLIRI